MQVVEVIWRLDSVLRDLAAIDVGYPLGENCIFPPKPHAASALSGAGLGKVKGLFDLYLACDGINMPDVHNGYFVKPLDKLLKFDPASEPETVLLESRIPVLSIGSTGGGGLFVVDRESGRVLLLPTGRLCEGCYDGGSSKVEVIAGSIPVFLERLLEDATAFVRDQHDHRYLTAR
jgi:hypothetical protein